MSKVNLFADWIKNSSLFLVSSAVHEWEQIVSKELLQKTTKKLDKKQNAKIVDFKLREAFAELSFKDFVDPSGFSEAKKASSRVKNYLDVRSTLEFFVKNDIEKHSRRKSQLHAFCQWVEVAELLRKKHCYEGYFLVVNTLLQLDITFKFCQDLPKSFQKTFDKQTDMISPCGNFANLRKEINKNPSDKKFIPVFLRAKDIAALNFVIESDSESSSEESKKSSNNLKSKILINILGEQKNTPVLPKDLQTVYKKTRRQYQNSYNAAVEQQMLVESDKAGEKGTKTAPAVQKTPSHDKLSCTSFYNELLPSFWRKKYNKSTSLEKDVAVSSNSPRPK